MTSSILEVRHLTKEFKIGGLLSRKKMRAVDDVSFALPAGSTDDSLDCRRIRLWKDHADEDDSPAARADERERSAGRTECAQPPRAVEHAVPDDGAADLPEPVRFVFVAQAGHQVSFGHGDGVWRRKES